MVTSLTGGRGQSRTTTCLIGKRSAGQRASYYGDIHCHQPIHATPAGPQ